MITVPAAGTPSRAARSTPARSWLAAAVDVGGTKIAGGLVDQDGRLHHRVQVRTPQGADADTTFAAVARAISALAEHPAWADARWVGVGSAGPVDLRSGTVSPVNIGSWRGFPLADEVAALNPVADRPVVLSGDGVAMAAAEHWLGAAHGAEDALCLVVSTGVGAGLVLDGRVRQGPSGNAGHLGHITVDLDGADCPCGSRGCLEGLASGPAIVRAAQRNGWQATAGPATAVTVATDAARGDRAALAALDRAAQALAAGIAATATLVDLELAVIGGGVAEAGDLLLTPLRDHLRSYTGLRFTAGLRVERARLRTDAGLVGAAALAAAAADGLAVR